MRLQRTASILVIAVALMTLRAPEAAADQALTGYSNSFWTAKDGLPSPLVSAIAQDRDGYLWLGSSAGLIRFDGVRFVSWNALGRTPLPETPVRSLYVSRDGSLWIGFGNLGGVSRIQEGTLHNYSPQDELPEGAIRSLLEDNEGTIWAGGFSGLARFRNGAWEKLGTQHGLPDATTVDNLYEDRNGNLFAATSAGVLRRNRQLDILEPTDAGSYRAMDVAQGVDGSIWITGQQEPFRPLHSAAASESTREGSGSIYGYRLTRDRHGNLWVATLGQGLLHVPNSQWRKSPVVERFTRQQGLTSDWVTVLFEDRDGGMWVGTEGGLNRFAKAAATSPVTNRSEFEGRTVRAVAATRDGSLWTGTINGLHRLWHETERWYTERDGLPSAVIRVLHTDTDATLWAATSRGPARFADGRFTALHLPGNVRLDRIEAMTSDLQGNLWLCDFAGIYRWKDGVLTEVKIGTGSVRRTPTSAAYADSLGRVWIGFSGGGLVMHQNGVFKHYSVKDGLSDGAVSSIYEDKAGTIWVGTLNGLSRFGNGAFVSITHSSGLPGNTLTATVQQDEEGYLWLGTDVGLVRLKPDEFDKALHDPSYRVQHRLLDVSDGLLGVPTSPGQPTSVRSHDGSFWFITSGGVAQVNPRELPEDPPPVAPAIESIAADEQVFVLPHPQLPAGTSRVQVDYTSPTFAGASRVVFRYRLEGYDTHWIDAGTRRQAFYTNLPPRGYAFRVAASRGEGSWVESRIPLEFSIAPAFYQTTWFYAACVVAPVLGLWGAWRLRIRQVRKQFSLVLVERERLAREIHDTLLQGMLGVALQLHGVSETLDSPLDTTRERCERARDRLEHYIRETRQSIWDLRSPTLERDDLATALRGAVDSIASEAGARVSLQVGGEPRPCGQMKEKHVLRIGREAISNAVRHGQATHVRVHLAYNGSSVVLRVADDGRGFDVESAARATGAHWGLRMMEEHAQQVGGRLSLMSSPGEGTQVEVVVPLAPA